MIKSSLSEYANQSGAAIEAREVRDTISREGEEPTRGEGGAEDGVMVFRDRRQCVHHDGEEKQLTMRPGPRWEEKLWSIAHRCCG